MNYYDQLLNQFERTNPYVPPVQKTPEQQLMELKQSKYPEYCNTPRGAEKIKVLGDDYDDWYNETYGVKPPVQSKDIDEMKAMMEQLAKQNEALQSQLTTLTSQFK